MMKGKRSQVIFLLLLSLSAVLHFLAWQWLYLKDWLTTPPASQDIETTIQITLKKNERPEPTTQPDKNITDNQPQPEEHQTQHNADAFSSSNNTDKSITDILKGKRPNTSAPEETQRSTDNSSIPKASNPENPSPIAKAPNNKTNPNNVLTTKKPNNKNQSSIKPTEKTSIAELSPVTPNKPSDNIQVGGSLSTEFEFQQPNTKIPDDMLASLGNMEMLDDTNLSDINATDPFSEIESQRIKMVNRYLQRMEKQIKAGWVKPVEKAQIFSGVIKFSLTPYGQLTDAYIYLGSGDSALDQSALEAVQRVKKFAVPESPMVAAKYYNSLRFQYSSHESSREAVPLRGKPETLQ